jgi:membrane-bound ClpP family serine protease
MNWLHRQWWRLLVGAFGIFYLLIGIEASGPAKTAGIVGGVLILGGALVSPSRLAPWLVVVGSLPLALLTWWSVVTPVMGGLAIVLARIMSQSSRKDRRAHAEDEQRAQ